MREETGRLAVPGPDQSDLAAVTWSGTRRRALMLGAGAVGLLAAGSLTLTESKVSEFQAARREEQARRKRQSTLPLSFLEDVDDNMKNASSYTRVFPTKVTLDRNVRRRLSGADGFHDYLTFCEKQGGAKLWEVRQRLTFQAEVNLQLVDIGLVLSRSGPPLNGTLMWAPPSGSYTPQAEFRDIHFQNAAAVARYQESSPVSVIRLDADLDTKGAPVLAKDQPDQAKPFFASNLVSLKAGEVAAFDLAAHTAKSHYIGAWKISYVVEGVQRELRSLKPFNVSAGVGEWRRGERPDFGAYAGLYVAQVEHGALTWQEKDPKRYRG